jgi:copper chaperone CopZ
MNRATLTINGMSCGHCVASVRRALEDVEGVRVESVTIGSAVVDYDPAVASRERIIEAVSDAGYATALAG